MATSKNTFSWEDPFNLSAQLSDDERIGREPHAGRRLEQPRVAAT